MAICLLSVLLGALCGVAALVLRRTTTRRVTVAHPAVDAPVVQELPPELQHLPEPPVLRAADVEILDPLEVSRRLRELELGICGLEPVPAHEQIVAAAIAAIGDPATQRRYSPRRPNLLPQLMRAINDEEMSRRELAAIIARDPSLVGSLLKMANSAYYRVSIRPVESIERAVVILGSNGLRSLIAAALMQPIFQVASGAFPRFPEIVWEHAMRAAHAAIPHAALVERADPFAAELLSLISGLAEIVLFRAAMDHWASAARGARLPDPAVLASLLDSQAATYAWRIGADWQLSELLLAALEEQMIASEPTTPLGRSLRFGRCAGALAVLHTNSVINDATVRLSLPEAGLSPAHLKCMWSRLLQKHEDPRLRRPARAPARDRPTLASAA